MDLTITFTFCALGGYLLGSIPFGLVITRLAGLGDIRKSDRATSEPPTFCAPGIGDWRF